ncbi:MAG: hypothetical protein ACFB6R_05570 [Alphaproteobacteria bacterium]
MMIGHDMGRRMAMVQANPGSVLRDFFTAVALLAVLTALTLYTGPGPAL